MKASVTMTGVPNFALVNIPSILVPIFKKYSDLAVQSAAANWPVDTGKSKGSWASSVSYEGFRIVLSLKNPVDYASFVKSTTGVLGPEYADGIVRVLQPLLEKEAAEAIKKSMDKAPVRSQQ